MFLSVSSGGGRGGFISLFFPDFEVACILWLKATSLWPVLLSLQKQSFSCGSAGKESACNEGDLGSIPGLGTSPEEGKGYPLQYSGLENSMECIVHGVAKSRT